jgi:hypothetical protein
MSSIAATLREEIRRLAHKEVKVQFGSVKQGVSWCRQEITAMRKMLLQQDRKLRYLTQQMQQQRQPQAEENPLEGIRFSARSVKAQRRRLGLSAADYGKLVGVTGLTQSPKT